MARFDRLALLALLCGCNVPPESDYVEAGSSCSGAHLYANASNGHCYEFVPGSLPWASAESDCVAWGGHLVSISSADEQAFVSTIVDDEVSDAAMPPGAWIGLGKASASAPYAWTDGEPLSFTNWATGSPTGKECVFMYTDKLGNRWDDFQCIVNAPHVCER